MSVKEVQPLNALSPMRVTLSGITRLFKDEQPSNAQSPMLAPVARITRLLKDEYVNTLSTIPATQSGITRLCKELQNKNASFPMLVTLSGMIISNRELQPLNADSANMANQLIQLRTKQKDAEVIMQTLCPNRIHIPNCYWEYLQKWYGKI